MTTLSSSVSSRSCFSSGRRLNISQLYLGPPFALRLQATRSQNVDSQCDVPVGRADDEAQ